MDGFAASLASKLGWNSLVCGRIRNVGHVGINNVLFSLYHSTSAVKQTPAVPRP
jgi:hypothetical protein